MKEWMKRRGLWIAMLVIMLAIVCAGTAGAEETIPLSYYASENEYVDGEPTQIKIYIHGTGVLDASLWNDYQYKDRITQFELEDGITVIRAGTFTGLRDNVRVDFTGSSLPNIEEGAFGSTVKCRYTNPVLQNAAPAGWVYLPKTSSGMIYSTSGQWITYAESNGVTDTENPVLLSDSQINEYLWNGHVFLYLNQWPTETDLKKVTGPYNENWPQIKSINIGEGVTGTINLTLPSGISGQFYIKCYASDLDLTIDGTAAAQMKLELYEVGGGKISYTGNLHRLTLKGQNNADVNVVGNIDTLDIEGPTSTYAGFNGRVTVTGDVQSGVVYGDGTISLPNVEATIPGEDLVVAELNSKTYDGIVYDNGMVGGKWNAVTDIKKYYSHISYMVVGESNSDVNTWYADLVPQYGYNLVQRQINISALESDFSCSDIVWDELSTLSVHNYHGTLDINNNGSPEVIPCGIQITDSTAVINCPVSYGSLDLHNLFHVTINNSVDSIEMKNVDANSSITLGVNGDVGGGWWPRYGRKSLLFDAVSGTDVTDLLSDGQLHVFGYTVNNGIKMILPSDKTVTQKITGGLTEGTKVGLDLQESSLNEKEEEVLRNMLNGKDDIPGRNAFAVLDLSLLAYNETSGTMADSEFNSLSSAVPVQVSDRTDHSSEHVAVVRLHEETNGLVAEELPATVNGDVITFASDKFSKFVLLSGEATEDKQFDKPEIGLQETYQSNEPIQITLPQVADAATYAIEILNGETVQYSAAWNAGEVGNQGCVFELNTMEGETIQRPMEPGNYIARITLTGEGYTDGIFDYPFEVEEDNPSAKSIEWTLTNGILNIQYTGSGPSVIAEHPWTEQAEEIIQVIIGEGITEIGADAFAGCSNMTSITIPGSVTKIAEAFTGCSALAEVYFGGIEEDLTGMTVRSYKPGYEPISKARKICRESTVVNMENYSFAFTCQKTDGSVPQLAAGEEGIVYTVENYEEIRLILAGDEIAGYTKSYRLEADYKYSRLAAEGTGTASTSILPSFGMVNMPIWYRAYAVYEPQDKESPVLISEKKTISFQTKTIRDLEEDIVNAPTVYVLGTEGGYTIQLTLPKDVEPEALLEWRVGLEKGYTTLYDAKSNRNSDSWIQGSRTQTMTIPDSEMEGGKRYILEVSAKVLGYREYFYNNSFIVLNAGEDPSKLLDSPEISFSKHFYYQGEAAVLTIKKVEHAENYTIRIRNEEEAECYTTVKTAKDFAGGESLQVRIQTDDFTKEQYYRAEVVCSADEYISNISKISSEAGFDLYDIGIPSLSVSAPEQYIKKRNPAETDGLLITVSLGWNMQGCEADNWLLTVKKGTETVLTRERQEDSYNGFFLVPDNCLTAGEEYTYSLTLWFGGFETYKSEEKSFRVLAPAEDSLTYEVSDVYTPEGRKKVLNITANGEIPDYTTENQAPWAASGNEVYQINLKGDLSRIGNNAFAGFNKDGLRITFYQGGKPVISEMAFAGCNHIVCRYYTENSSWAGGGKYGAETVEWIYLPVDRGTGYDGDAAWFDYTSSGWALLIYNSETSSYVRHPMTLRQAQETAYGENILIDFYAFPKASDSVLYAGWKNVRGVSFLDGFSGNMEMNLGSDHVISRVTVDSPDANIVIHNPKKLELLRCGSGTLNYTGNIREVTLSEGESNSDSVTVTGTIDTLSFYTAPQYKAYRGSMTLNGTITAGTVAGGVSIEIPGIGAVPIDNLASYTFGTVTKENEKVIEEGVWLGDKTEARISLEMYKLWYGITDFDSYRSIMLTLTPKEEYQDVLGTESIPYSGGNITTDQIVCGEDTSITIQTFPRNGKVVLNGVSEDGQRKGYGSVDVLYGDVEINCPVDTITVANRSRYTTGINLVINDQVNLLELQSIQSGTIVLDQNGEVNNGIWRRANQAIRYFGPVTDGGTLYQKGGLYAMSWREGETLKSLLPGEDEISAAAGLNDGRIASADVSESSVSDLHVNESTALDNYLSTNGGETKAVFDATVMAYSMDADGNAGEGEPVTSLNSPIGFQISNETGEAVCVVRLHEENGTVNAEKVSEVTDDTVISFESSLLSKYAIVTAGEALPEPTDIFIIPSSVTVIEEDAFSGTAGDMYVIPNGVKAIPSGAFANLQKTAVIVIPDSVETISDQAFQNSTITIQCSSGSFAAQWAAKHQITRIDSDPED